MTRELLIVAFVFSVISMYVSSVSMDFTLWSSVIAVIVFPAYPVAAGVVILLNILSTMNVLPTLYIPLPDSIPNGDLVGLHIVLFIIAIIYWLIRKR